jgi:ParB-like chromosome segregation protein Spo0J
MDGLQHIDPNELRPWRVNARTHPKKQVRQIADSISQFGFTNPILIDFGSPPGTVESRLPSYLASERFPA